MDEDLKDQDLGELDLRSMEDACTKKSFDSIPARQIWIFQESFVKDKVQNKLRVYHLPKKDKNKFLRITGKEDVKLICNN